MTTKKTVASKLTIAMLEQSLKVANEAYIKRNGDDAVLNPKTGIQKDIERAYGFARSMSQAQLDEIVKLQAHTRLLEGLKDASSSKKPMRVLQALLFILTGSGKYLTGSSKTFLLAYCGLIFAGAKTKDGMRFCVTGKGDEHTSDQVFSTAKATKIRNAFGAVSEASYKTQKSVSFGGKGGDIASSLGLAKTTRDLPDPIPNLDNPLCARLQHWVNTVTDQQLELVVAQAKVKAK